MTAQYVHGELRRIGLFPRELVDAWLTGVRVHTGFDPRPDLIDIPGTCVRCL